MQAQCAVRSPAPSGSRAASKLRVARSGTERCACALRLCALGKGIRTGTQVRSRSLPRTRRRCAQYVDKILDLQYIDWRPNSDALSPACPRVLCEGALQAGCAGAGGGHCAHHCGGSGGSEGAVERSGVAVAAHSGASATVEPADWRGSLLHAAS